MQLDALRGLAERLYPNGQCRFVKPDIRIDSAFDHQARSPNRKDIGEVFDRLEEPGSWIALYDTQSDPEYDGFLREVIADATHLIAPSERVYDVRGFFFLSAPPSVTPFHIDRENNFWLQIHGRKMMHVWHRDDPEVVAAADVERFMVRRSLDNVRLTEGKLARSIAIDCGPGDGVYFPSTTPHMTRTDTSWVKPGNGVSVSVGVVFYTNRTRRDANVHGVNYLLRRIGFVPAPPRHGGFVDDYLKYPVGRLASSVLRRIGNVSVPPGF